MQFAANLTQLTCGPYNQNDAGTELVQVRRSCFCHTPYAALILDAPVTPRTAFTLIMAQLETDNKGTECQPLVRFLQAALLATANDGPSPLALETSPTAPLGDTTLVSHRETVLFCDFPSLNQNLAQLQQTQIATCIGELVEDNRAHREAKHQSKLASQYKQPVDLVGGTGVAKLCRFVRVPGQAQLPDIYRQLASASRHNGLAELQWVFDREKSRLGYHRLNFIVTPALLNIISGVRFIMDHTDNITSGLQPYLFGDITPEEAHTM